MQRSESKPISPVIETKQEQDPVIASWEAFYAPDILEIAKAFLKQDKLAENKQAEIDIYMRLHNATAAERERLSEWTMEKFGMFTNSKHLYPNLARDNTWIGMMHYFGILEKNHKQAFRFLDKGIQLEDAFACWVKAIYLKQIHQILNLPEIIRLLNIAKDKEIPHAFSGLGFFYLNFPKLDMRHEAFKTLQEASDKKSSRGTLNLGLCYRDGSNGADKDLKKAQTLCELAVSRGDELAFYQMARDFSTPERAKSINTALLKRKPNFTYALCSIGFFEKSRNKNPEQASFYYQLALRANPTSESQAATNMEITYAENKKNSVISINAALGFHLTVDEKLKRETRNFFNETRRKKPDEILAFSDRFNFPMDNFIELIDLTNKERRMLLKTFAALLFSPFAKDINIILLQYISPLPPKLVQTLAEPQASALGKR